MGKYCDYISGVQIKGNPDGCAFVPFCPVKEVAHQVIEPWTTMEKQKTYQVLYSKKMISIRLRFGPKKYKKRHIEHKWNIERVKKKEIIIIIKKLDNAFTFYCKIYGLLVFGNLFKKSNKPIKALFNI